MVSKNDDHASARGRACRWDEMPAKLQAAPGAIVAPVGGGGADPGFLQTSRALVRVIWTGSAGPRTGGDQRRLSCSAHSGGASFIQ